MGERRGQGRGVPQKQSREMRALWAGRVRPLLRELEMPAFILIAAAAFILSIVGYSKFFLAHGVERPLLDLVYLTFQMFRMIFLQTGPFPWELELARWLAVFVLLYAGLRVVTTLFYEQVQLLRLRWLTRDHVVVCGTGRNGIVLAGKFFDEGYRVVVVQKEMGKEAVQKCREIGVMGVSGSPVEMDTLRKVHVDRARYLVSVLGDDSDNVDVALRARDLSRSRRTTLFCHVQIVDRRLCNLLKANFELGGLRDEQFKLEFFNVYDTAARSLIERYPPFSEAGGRIAMVGLSQLGESFLFLAAAQWLSRAPAGARPAVTLAGSGAAESLKKLCSHYPLIAETFDMAAVDVDMSTPDLLRWDFVGDEVRKVYVFLESDAEALSAALSLRSALKDRVVQIIALMGRSSGLSRMIRDSGMKGLSAFEALDAIYMPVSILRGTREMLARAVHEDYVRGQLKLGHTLESNPSMAPWDDLPEGLRESNRSNADHILVKLNAVGCGIELLTDMKAVAFRFSAEEVELMARLEHDRWLVERQAQGWKFVPGPKDIDRKTSPYMVRWEELPEDIREYDRNTVRAMPLFLAGAGFRVYRARPLRAKEDAIEAKAQ
jgi:hypothetical protein